MALVLEQAPGRLDLSEITLDRPGAGEVVVQTAACAVCQSDVHFRDGLGSTPTPSVLGHEVAGRVVAVGSADGYLRPGDHVDGCMTVFCGQCRYCLTGQTVLCEGRAITVRPADAPPRLSRSGEPIHQFANLSGFAELLLVHERALVRIDDDIPPEAAALLGCAVVTGVGAVLNTAKVVAGETVLVVGCGGVGVNCIQGARLAGASRIIAIDTLTSKLDRARAFGATDTVQSGGELPVEEILELTAGGVDHAFEAVGRPSTAARILELTRRGGTATLVGMLPAQTRLSVSGNALMRIASCRDQPWARPGSASTSQATSSITGPVDCCSMSRSARASPSRTCKRRAPLSPPPSTSSARSSSSELRGAGYASVELRVMGQFAGPSERSPTPPERRDPRIEIIWVADTASDSVDVT